MVHYSIIDIVRNSVSLIYTKLFYPKARLVRWPLYKSGKGFKYGEGLTLGRGCRIDTKPDGIALTIGKNARIGDYVHINADSCVNIGDNVLMASKIFISDTNHGNYNGEQQSNPDENPSQRELHYMPVIIGNNVWIGENVVILQGTTIGDGCIIGANSVLSKTNYPNYCIIVGTPGRIIKQYNTATQKWERVRC